MPERGHIEGRLVDDRWFVRSGDELVMVASRCGRCGRLHFPPKRLCASCFELDTMETIPLSTRGTLFTYTVAEVGPPEFETPYAFGLVDLPEGLRLFSLLVDCVPFEERLRIGADVELSVGPIKRDAFGVQLVGYRFRPVAGERAR